MESREFLKLSGPHLFTARARIAKMLREFLSDGKLPNGKTVPEIVTAEGVDLDSIANSCGEGVARTIENNLAGIMPEHWSRQTQIAQDKHPASRAKKVENTVNYGKPPQAIKRGPGRHP